MVLITDLAIKQHHEKECVYAQFSSKFPGQKRLLEKEVAYKKMLVENNAYCETTRIFLTHSWLPTSFPRRRILEEALWHYQNVFQPPMRYVMSIELHSNGQPHIHSYLNFNEPRFVTVKNTRIPFGANGICSRPGYYKELTREKSAEMDIIQYILKNTRILGNLENLRVIDKQLPNDRNHLWCDPVSKKWIATNMQEIADARN